MKLREGALQVKESMIEKCIKALEYYAHMEAGQTQAPDLCKPEDYEEWEIAQALKVRMVKLNNRRNGIRP